MTQATDDLRTIEEIDGTFVPRPQPRVVTVVVGEELVVVGSLPHVLNPTASLVWRCFDGEGSVDELVRDLVEATQSEESVVRGDVLALTRQLAVAELLEGVAPAPIEGGAEPIPAPVALGVGDLIGPLCLPDLDGVDVSLDAMRGSRVLLVHWSPSCGFCVKIAGELSEHASKLADLGVTLAFLTAGADDANRRLFADAGITAPVFVKQDGVTDPFAGFGTPAAYLLEEDGKVAAEMAYGAAEVPALVRKLAGVEVPPDPEEPADGVRYIPVPALVCGPGAGGASGPATAWQGLSVYQVGDFHIGVRYNSEEAADLLDRLLLGSVVADSKAPDNYSVAIHPQGGGSRGLSLLVKGGQQLVRSRSSARVLQGLLLHLSMATAPLDPGYLHLYASVAVRDGEAFLLPNVAGSWLKQIQPRLARRGLQLADVPFAVIDPVSAELIVPEPELPYDRELLDRLDKDLKLTSELPRVRPGRYPISRWFQTLADGVSLTAAIAVANAVPMVMLPPDGLAAGLAQVVSLLASVEATAIAFDSPRSLADDLGSQLA